MGFWGTKLYANDTTCDVRGDYLEFLKDGLSNQEAYEKIMDKYKEYIGDEEETLFWYALAETQWQTGRLLSDVKEKAMEWIRKGGGLDIFEETRHVESWKKTIKALKNKLASPMPKERKIRKPVEFIRNPWNVNDIYAYQFHGEEAKERGHFGKYILIQKIADVPWYDNRIYSRIHVFDKIFNELPTLDDIDGLRLLPLVESKCVSLHGLMNVTMWYTKKSEYKAQYFTFIGNKIGPANTIISIASTHDWLLIDEWYSYLHLNWQGVEYVDNGDGTYEIIK